MSAAPFDLDRALNIVQRMHGEGQYAQDRYHARGQVFRHVTDLTAERDQARRMACSLESELAEQTDRIAEAKGLLSDALVWLDDRHDNVRDYVLEAISALEVKS